MSAFQDWTGVFQSNQSYMVLWQDILSITSQLIVKDFGTIISRYKNYKWIFTYCFYKITNSIDDLQVLQLKLHRSTEALFLLMLQTLMKTLSHVSRINGSSTVIFG